MAHTTHHQPSGTALSRLAEPGQPPVMTEPHEGRRAPRRVSLLDARTYALSLHLVADLAVGIMTFTIMVALLAVSAGLAVTLVGLPLLAVTLQVARGVGLLERRRARVIGVSTTPPLHPGHGLRARLLDPADWRAALYAVLLLPSGVITGTVTVVGWATAVAAIAAPFLNSLGQDSMHSVGGIRLDGPVPMVASVTLGLALLTLMPTVVRGLGRVDALLVHRLLGQRADVSSTGPKH
jgi:Putative sensor